MAEHPCFDTLTRATKSFHQGDHRQAFALAEASWKMLAEIPGAPPQAGLVCSWYGFLLGTVGGKVHDGLKIAREAADSSFWEPRVFEHLARLELQAGSRRRALEAVRRGLALAPGDRELDNLRRAIGVRRRPPVSFLDRGHPLNRMIGQWRVRSA